MSWRELRTFVRQIPPDSAYVRAVRLTEGDDPDWDTAAYLLARIANEVTTATYQRAGKRTPKGALIPDPGNANHKAKSRARHKAQHKAAHKANGHDKQLTQQDFDALFPGG